MRNQPRRTSGVARPSHARRFRWSGLREVDKDSWKDRNIWNRLPRPWTQWIRRSIEVFDRIFRTEHALFVNRPNDRILTFLANQKFLRNSTSSNASRRQ